MSFLTNEIAVPLWLLLLIISGLLPLFVKVIKFINTRIGAGGMFAKGRKGNGPAVSAGNKGKSSSGRQNEKNILKLFAQRGDQGMLLQSIADTLKIDNNIVKSALIYLEGKKLIEMVNGISGNKYFLTQAGKNFCVVKGYSRAA